MTSFDLQPSSALELRDYLRVVKRRRWLVVTGVVVGVALAFVFTVISPITYEASASVLVRPVSVDVESSLRIDQLVSMATERELMRSAAIAERAAELMEADGPRGLLERITIIIPEGTQILEVSFEASTPEKAQQGAQAFVAAYLEHRGSSAAAIVEERRRRVVGDIVELGATLVEANRRLVRAEQGTLEYALAEADVNLQNSRVRALYEELAKANRLQVDPGEVILPAAFPASPSSQPTWLLVVIGALAGGTLALPLAFVRHRFDDRIWDEEDLERFGSPVLASVLLPPPTGDHEDLLSRLSGPNAERFRRFSLAVMSAMSAGGGTRLAVAAVHRVDNAPEVVVELAVATARMGHSVLLMGADEGSESIGSYLPVDPGPGLGDVLLSGRSIVEVIQAVEELPQLRVMLEGTPRTDAVQWEAFAGLIQKLPGSMTILMVNTAPVLDSTDSLRLSSLMDGIVLVATRGLTRLGDLNRARDELSRGRAKLLGVVYIAGRQPTPWLAALTEKLKDSLVPPYTVER